MSTREQRTASNSNEVLRRVEHLCVAICHDLRAPVATAGAAIHSLTAATPLHADLAREQDRLLEIARHGIDQAAELLGALPRLVAGADPASTGNSASPAAVIDLGRLIDDVRDDLRFELRMVGGALVRRGTLPHVRGDRDRLRIAVRGLVRNSIRHRRDDTALEVVARAFRRGGRTTLTISDNGRGLDPGARARLFAPLQRGPGAAALDGLHSLERGLGLGLAIAQRELAAMGGRLAACAPMGRGASFAITLPAADRDSPDRHDADH